MTARLYTSPAGHVYKLDGQKVPSVTTILNALPKQLTQWSSDQAANYAVEHWDELTEETMTRRLDRIRFAHRDSLSSAALRGTTIHRYGETLVAGGTVEDPEYLGPAQAYARFLDKWDITELASETPLVNLEHRYAGRPDLWCHIGARDDALALVDLKTGRNVYESTVLQLTAYAYADLWQPHGPDSESDDLPDIDLMYVAHIGADDVRMLPVERRPGVDFRQFLYVKQTWQWLQAHGFKGDQPLIGEADAP